MDFSVCVCGCVGSRSVKHTDVVGGILRKVVVMVTCAV